jgi:hypothetical protein
VARLLAEQHGLEYLDLSTAQVDPHAAGLLTESYPGDRRRRSRQSV